MPNITTKLVTSLKPQADSQFIRDQQLTGFGVKVSPKGRVSYILEGRIRGGRTRRITLGQHPALSVSEARDIASKKLALMHQGIDPVEQKRAEAYREAALSMTVKEMFASYMQARTLKPKTITDYWNTFNLVFADWHTLPVRSISRKLVEEKFVETRDTRGKPTATKSLRIISAAFNHAMAEEINGERLIASNPTDVLKQKRYDRKIKRRTRFLSDGEISKLITFYHDAKDWPEASKHGVTDQGINYIMLLMSSGLRRSEGMRLKWDDIHWSNEHLVVHETKNSTDHYIPLSSMITWILKKQRVSLHQNKNPLIANSPWVFPARIGSGHMTEPKSQLAAICKAVGFTFSLHDLRRTFATHAEANGVGYKLIKKALNHKSQSVTEGYIISQISVLRPVFEAVAEGYHSYYDPNWKTQLQAELALDEEVKAGNAPADAEPIVFEDLSKKE